MSNLLYSTAKILGSRRFTVPRTELLSAELLVKLTKMVEDAIEDNVEVDGTPLPE